MTIPFPGLSGSENDHQYRSSFIQWLLHQIQPLEIDQSSENPIPRILIQYWHNLNQLPEDVQECLDSWDPLLDIGFKRLLFDDNSARSYIYDFFDEDYVQAFDHCYHPAMRCDFFRLCYIYKNGGWYVDADEVYQGADCDFLFTDNRIKIQPLCYDLMTKEMVNPKIFLNDNTLTINRIYYVNNNPIIGPAGHELLRIAIERSKDIFLNQDKRQKIQSTTGPGNLSASLVKHAIKLILADRDQDFYILSNWEKISACRWHLSYRNDERNWRLLNNPRQL